MPSTDDKESSIHQEKYRLVENKLKEKSIKIERLNKGLKESNKKLEEANKRLSKARELLLCGDIEADDYRTIKAESEERINRLEAKLTTSVTDTTNIEPLWDKAISSISQLDVLYENGTVTQKRKIIGSMFPEKLTFDGFQYRTTRINEALNLMLLINNQIQSKKNGTNPLNLDLSQEVTQLGATVLL